PPREELFLSSQRFPGQEMAFLVRTEGDPAGLGSAVTRAIRQVDPQQPAIGIYGVMAYNTTQRRHEIGIRMALGAGSREVLGLVVGQGMRLVGLGLLIGLTGAWVLSRVLTSQLYGVTARDPMTYLTVAVLLGAVALAALYVPARRAVRLDPLTSLRSEWPASGRTSDTRC